MNQRTLAFEIVFGDSATQRAADFSPAPLFGYLRPMGRLGELRALRRALRGAESYEAWRAAAEQLVRAGCKAVPPARCAAGPARLVRGRPLFYP